jgi:hypothetical protein
VKCGEDNLRGGGSVGRSKPTLLACVHPPIRPHHYESQGQTGVRTAVAPQPGATRYSAEIDCTRLQPIPVSSGVAPARPGRLPSRGYPQNLWPGVAK